MSDELDKVVEMCRRDIRVFGSGMFTKEIPSNTNSYCQGLVREAVAVLRVLGIEVPEINPDLGALEKLPEEAESCG